MPLLASDQSEAVDAPLGHFPAAPKPVPQPEGTPGDEAYHTLNPLQPEFLERASAALRMGTPDVQAISEGVQGLFEPQTSGAPQPGYDFLNYIPPGFLHQYGSRYADTVNPAQAQKLTEKIREEQADQAVLARSGWLGHASLFAAGAVDPVNLAAMALVPEAAPTRLGNMMRWGLTNAVVTGGQEAIRQGEQATAAPGEALFNVSANAILGGLLGSLAPKVPRGTFAKLAEDLHADLHPAPAEPLKAVEPGTGIDLPKGPETLLPKRSALVAVTEGPVPEAPPGRPEPRYVAPRPEPPSPPRPGFTPEIEPQRMSLTEAIAVTKGTSAEAHGLSFNEAIAQGLDPADLTAARFGSRRVFTKGGASFDEMAEALHQHGYPVQDEAGNYSPNALLDAIDKELRGKRQYSTAADDYLEALAEHEHATAHPEEPRAPYEAELERDARMLESKEAEHALPGEPAYVNPETESTMGAAAARGPTAERLTTGRGAQAYTATVGRMAVAGRLIRATSVKARQLLTELANIPGTLEQNYAGVASANPIERLLWRYDGLHVTGMKARRAAYGEYVERVKSAGQTPMARRDFMEEVAKSMRRGDTHAVAEVAKAAKWTREHIFEPLFQRAKQGGMLPEQGRLFAESYLTRLYDTQKIRENFGGWIDRLRQGFIKQGVDPAEATDLAHAASRNVQGAERGTMDWHALDGVVPQSGRMKGRTLSMPDEWLEPFLSNDIDHLSHSYLRSMAPEVEITERFGSRDLKDQFGEITDEYAHMIEQARAAGDNSKMAALDAERTSVIKQLSAVRDRLYGIYGAPKDPGAFFVRAGRMLRFENVLRLLGAATLAHFPDLANVISRYGTGNTFAAMAKLATSLQASKMAMREAQRMGAAIDMTMNISASLLGDYGTHSRYLEQRVMGQLTRAFTIGTGETPLITLVQGLASTMAQHEILKVADKVAAGGVLTKNLAAKLAAAGLDTGMLERISGASAQHTRNINGLNFGMSETWADQKAAQAFESAVLREAHGVTLRPGVGDTPLFMSTEWGKLIAQFKTFAFAASRVVGTPVLQGIAHADARTVEALTALVAMGTLSYVTKQKAAGQPLETNPGRLALEVLDKSNLLGWTGEAIFPSLWLAGFKDLSRWSDRDPYETLLGPSVGTLGELWQHQYPARIANLVTGGASAPGQEELPFRRSDEHFLRRMAWGQNLWYMRRGINAMEDGVGDLFNLPGQSNAEREESRFAGNVSIQ